MDLLDTLRLVFGAAVLTYAARSDWRTREVRDRAWILLGSVGLILFGYELVRDAVEAIIALALVPAVVLFYGVFFGEDFVTETGWRFPPATFAAYGIALVAALYPIVTLSQVGDALGLRSFVVTLTPAVMMLVFRGMYQAHLIKGGADAKAMIAIAALVPMYPSLDPALPLLTLGPRIQEALTIVFPFAFLVLLNAALLLVIVPIALLLSNAARGDAEIPEAFLGYTVPVDRVPRFVWFMDQVVEGEHVRILFPRKRQDRAAIARDLKVAGVSRVWVTPQLPFLVPLAIAYVVSFVIGNPLLGLMQAALPVP